MTILEHDFLPGNLVRARGREWVVQSDSRRDWLRLRPLSGADDESIALIPELELHPVEPATFDWPDPARAGNHAAALLLRDALRLTLRAGAGPFRSFGNIAVEPRGYQLVPLLMALRLSTVRLLIADDVGIGKTIEAGLIARELMDRGEIARLAILCPPHLVEQWQSELETRFNLQAVALTSASASRIERDLPHGARLFDHHPVVVVSLDYIKSERHREQFLATAPECIIVDEAHTCASSGAGKQLRFELLQRLARDAQRHLVLLTATPHSGDETAFYNLLSLLDPRFSALQGRMTASDPLRQELARHFVQRRRKDIVEWQAEIHDGRGFPRRMKTELTYQLSGEWGAFFDAVQDYCRELAETVEQQEQQGGARLIWYATLALLRCVASSPAAAVKALTTRLEGTVPDEALLGDERLHDGEADDLSGSDLEPPAQVQDAAPRLQALIADAQRLSGKAGDPKLAALIRHIDLLVKDGYHPVVFCRYIATAHYVAEHLKAAFPKATVDAVTGELTPEERRERVDELEDAERRILVATDCLSEGINLQHLFTAVVHYDLAWNPTRHEQREGRVDRFGQQADEVRCTMLYGQDNPVDGFVLNVILKKGEAIQKELGVLVPMPEDEARINQALVKAALMKRSDSRISSPQAVFDFGESEQLLAPLQGQWRDALEKAKANRTVFAQRRIKPDEVLPEWHKQQQALGTQADVSCFLQSACVRLGSPLEIDRKQTARFLPQHLPEALRQRLADEGIDKPQLIDFIELHRSHPLVGLLAQHLLEDALGGERPLAARCAATLTNDVEVVTTLYLLRLRHQLSYVRRREPFQMMAEETVALAVQGRNAPQWLADDGVSRLLECTPSGNLPPEAAQREIRIALDFLAAHPQQLQAVAQQRADALLADHQRVRKATRDVGQYSVSPCLPVDVMGVYVLLPDSL
ncbi:Superfamily II DNA/RNA helicase, SNF2 family [Cupriavidus gilardii CR3]|uniref:DEAD/DEAH box helicase n=1 Tax=Cupriavidus gilardii TaxID=82541 RepID=A0A849BFW7_9BURK|nr:helicase-related protein [Cupriavidus gilardii]ALD91665.1 Superfamily II DNA/RNA helicase, SNF2 family [Cupriavidus gilardii CR3]KAB0595451.1 DEAD/DEAH box helicase [Cupriavidus gilardii]MCT9016218.1 DEAD/DEAH box helicase [Cupriavidus gilardii]MCT9055988.1 DEAD/DEAH box helicase [Cupriavidus gilardii]NNH11497.1 DEAD/DEAH box helicase [Cupriavidus gilardii]